PITSALSPASTISIRTIEASALHQSGVNGLTEVFRLTGEARQRDVARAPAVVIELEIAAVLVPVGEHEALACAAVDDQVMACGPVRVPVDHPRDAGVAKGGRDGLRIDIHEPLRFRGVRRPAPAAQPARDAAPNRVGEREIASLPTRVVRDPPKALIPVIGRAELVAVQDQGRRAREVDDELLRQERDTRGSAEMLAKQEVAIASDKADGHARRANALDRAGDLEG